MLHEEMRKEEGGVNERGVQVGKLWGGGGGGGQRERDSWRPLAHREDAL